jgi:hypothetical protein
MIKRCLFFLLWSTIAYGQNDTLNLSRDQQNAVEEVLQSSGTDGAEDMQNLYDRLQAYRRDPIDLNSATSVELRELGLFTEVQITDLQTYRQKNGKLIAPYEMQAIPSWDMQTIQRILPFVTVQDLSKTFRVPLKTSLIKGENTLLTRWERNVEPQLGYENGKYLGTPNKMFLRFKHTYGTHLSYGVTMENDAGEPFFKNKNKQGFDFYSAHFYVKDISPRIKNLVLGDFVVNFGQGLVLWSDFATAKSSMTMNIKRGGRTIRPFSSVNESRFFRGAGATIALGEKLELTTFASYRYRDATTATPEPGNPFGDEGFASFSISGYHRTETELANKNTIMQFTGGARLQYGGAKGHFAINSLFNSFSKPLILNTKPYNQFSFQGSQLLNLSADYSYRYRNLNFFGETASSGTNGLASVNGLLVGLDRRMSFSLLHRYLTRNYHALVANPFAENNTGVNNENGFYVGLEMTPNAHWKFHAFGDVWQHPWLRYQVNSPSQGYEYLARMTYWQKRKLEIYLQFRTKMVQRNSSLDNGLSNTVRHQVRLDGSFTVSPVIELRSRAEIMRFDDGDGNLSNGYMVYQDVVFSPKNFPISFTSRYALFNTDDYNSRIYTYENDILYAFAIPSYANQGSRFYINLRGRLGKHLVAEVRFAQTFYTNVTTVGSGNDLIDANTNSDVKVQLKYGF